MQSELWKSDANWFADWFNSPAYHILYGHRDEAEAAALVERLAARVCPPAPADTLDLGCGSGRHVRSFQALGYRAYGVDLSPASIAEAQRLSAHPERYAVADMRAFADGPQWHHRFDAITSLFTSFGYFDDPEDERRTLRGIRRALRPGGVFVLDFLNVSQVRTHLVPSEVAHRKWPDGRALAFTIHRRIHSGWIEKSIAYTDIEGQHRHVVERVRALTRDELVDLVTGAGFAVDAIFGDYALQSLGDASNRCILVAS